MRNPLYKVRKPYQLFLAMLLFIFVSISLLFLKSIGDKCWLCRREWLVELLQRAVAYRPRFRSGVWFVLQGIPGGIAKSGG